MLAITTLLVVVATSLLITRVATVILTATGMAKQTARFQARSAFTGAGFTTTESERVLQHPVRRRVIMALMLLGNAGIVAAASALILGFKSGAAGAQGLRVLELGLGMLALVYLSRSRWVDQRLNRLISNLLGRYTDLPTRDLDALLDLSGPFEVSELAVAAGDWVAGATLEDLSLRDEGVVVLGITRPDGRFVGVPAGSTRIRPDDVLVVYGPADALAEIDRRPRGPDGDARRHAQAAARHRRRPGHEGRRALRRAGAASGLTRRTALAPPVSAGSSRRRGGRRRGDADRGRRHAALLRGVGAAEPARPSHAASARAAETTVAAVTAGSAGSSGPRTRRLVGEDAHGRPSRGRRRPVSAG